MLYRKGKVMPAKNLRKSLLKALTIRNLIMLNIKRQLT